MKKPAAKKKCAPKAHKIQVRRELVALRRAWITWRAMGQRGFEPVSADELDRRIDLLAKGIRLLPAK